MNKPDHNPALVGQEHYARLITKRLSAGMEDIPHDISERLRIARAQALSKRKVTHATTLTNPSGGAASLMLGGNSGFRGLWRQLASALPLIALVAGLFAISTIQDDNRVSELAEVDAALLTDDLPPAAYLDPGFLQYLKTNSRDLH